MKTREYEFEGRTYRWSIDVSKAFLFHLENDVEGKHSSWHPSNIPPTPAAASALAALIEGMQVQVIAEWDSEGLKWQARDTSSGPVVEWWGSGAEEWIESGEATSPFRAGWEAGKAAR